MLYFVSDGALAAPLIDVIAPSPTQSLQSCTQKFMTSVSFSPLARALLTNKGDNSTLVGSKCFYFLIQIYFNQLIAG